MSDTIRTCKARVSFPTFFVPRISKEYGGDAKYSCTLLFDDEARATAEYKAMMKAAFDAAVAKWPDQKTWYFGHPMFAKQETTALAHAAASKTAVNKVRWPLRDGKEKVHLEGYEGCTFINCSSKMKPQVVNGKKEFVTDDMQVYAGMYVRATLNIYAYAAPGNWGVGFGLRNVQLLSDGEPLGGRSNAGDEFEAVGGEAGSASVDDMFT